MALTALAIYTILNFLLIFIDLRIAIFFSIGLQVFILVSLYILIFRPLQKKKNNFLTLCSWTNQYKDDEGDWHAVEVLLEKLGFSVTHGISQEGLKKVHSDNDNKS